MSLKLKLKLDSESVYFVLFRMTFIVAIKRTLLIYCEIAARIEPRANDKFYVLTTFDIYLGILLNFSLLQHFPIIKGTQQDH